MSDTSESIPAQAAAPAWVLQSTIDDARLAQLRDALADTLVALMVSRQRPGPPGRLLAALDAYSMRRGRLGKVAVAVFPWLCGFGLALALAFCIGGGIVWHGYRADLFFMLYFGAGLLLVRPLRRLQSRPRTQPLRWRLPQPTWLWKMLARRISINMLRVAQRMAPFDAQYAFAGRTITYARVTPAGTGVVWQRTLQGWRVSGTGFTLLLKSPKALQGILILHEPSARLDAWLDELGIEPVDAAQAAPARA